MHYRAEVYIDSVIVNTFIAGSLEVLKAKAEPYIKDEIVTEIRVEEVKQIGFFKVPEELKEYSIMGKVAINHEEMKVKE